jgi:nitrogen fixation/metabolism regulation signal transduction histidine kinase
LAEQRKKIWIDRFQTWLFLRIAFYFLIYQIATWFLVIVERNVYVTLQDILGQDAAAYGLCFLVGVVVLLGLLFIYDAVAFAHRVVGPIYRFRKTIQAVTAGEELDLINLRKGDFLMDMKDDVNAMLKALEQRGAVVLKKREARPEPQQPAVAAAEAR